MTEHDYTRRYWGHDLTIEPVNGGQSITGWIWGYGLHDGDYLILRNGGGTTRYRLTKVDYQADPLDMARYTAGFAPREATA